MLFNQNKVKNTLKSIKNVLKNIKYLIISLWKTCGKPMLICGKLIIYGVLLSLCDYNVGRLMSLYLINPSESCYLSEVSIRNANCQPPKVTKPPQIPHKSPQRHINTPKVLDIHSQVSYSTLITHQEHSYVRCISSSTEAKVSCDY